MTTNELSEIVTKGDLENHHKKLLHEIKLFIIGQNPKKEFLSPKEFSAATGEKYSTILYKCKIGRLKARQDAPNSTWQIHASEIDRYKKEAVEIYTDK